MKTKAKPNAMTKTPKSKHIAHLGLLLLLGGLGIRIVLALLLLVGLALTQEQGQNLPFPCQQVFHCFPH